VSADEPSHPNGQAGREDSPSPTLRQPKPNSTGSALGKRLRERDLGAAPAALNLLESSASTDREQAAALLREVSPAMLGGEAPGHIVGVTGPPGAGKSTLLSALLHAWRSPPSERTGASKSVAMLAHCSATARASSSTRPTGAC
jgi:LAO/AO transport system kinase